VLIIMLGKILILQGLMSKIKHFYRERFEIHVDKKYFERFESSCVNKCYSLFLSLITKYWEFFISDFRIG